MNLIWENPAPRNLLPVHEFRRHTTEGITASRVITIGASLIAQDRAEASVISRVIGDAKAHGYPARRKDVRIIGGPTALDHDTTVPYTPWKLTAIWRPTQPDPWQLNCVGGPADGATAYVRPGQASAPCLVHKSRGRTVFVFDVDAAGWIPQATDQHLYVPAGVDPVTGHLVFRHATTGQEVAA
ncbi:hypothetical protein [Micrococcus lylae]|uniref:Uncharacterized protein n=1 Tax=Micrococcus lylae TaxID=1273 RepID=A0ABY2JWL9_9MICC|nr:hypothetical protein [Micrococcus lylae]TFH97829.1 hypothetical protein E4A49_11705 [Micrococcus lylae]